MRRKRKEEKSELKDEVKSTTKRKCKEKKLELKEEVKSIKRKRQEEKSTEEKLSSRSAKRKRNVIANGHKKAGIKVVKCTLNSVLQKHDGKETNSQKLRTTLIELATFMSNQRVLASMVVKHHLYTTMDQHEQLPFKVDLTYFTRALKAVNYTEFGDCVYKAQLLASRDAVFTKTTATFKTTVPGTVISQSQSYVAREMLTNFQTHISMHIVDVVNNWRNNQLRIIHQPEDMTWKEFLKAIRTGTIITAEIQQIIHKHQAFLDTLPSMVHETKSENEDGSVKYVYDYEKCLALFYTLRKDTEALADLRSDIKAFSVLPQCHVKLVSLRVDTMMLAWIYCESHPHCIKPSATKHTSDSRPTKQDLCSNPVYSAQVWGEYFDLRYIQRSLVRTKDTLKFNWSIVTNGYTVSLTYQKYSLKGITSPKTCTLSSTVKKAPRLYSEKKVRLPDINALENLNIWSIDPGVKDIIHVAHLNSSKSYRLTQSGYKDKSLMNWYAEWMKKSYSSFRTWEGSHVQDMVHQKTCCPQRVLQYAEIYGKQCEAMWGFFTRKKILKRNFLVWRRRT